MILSITSPRINPPHRNVCVMSCEKLIVMPPTETDSMPCACCCCFVCVAVRALSSSVLCTATWTDRARAPPSGAAHMAALEQARVPRRRSGATRKPVAPGAAARSSRATWRIVASDRKEGDDELD
eukprot:1741155-Prymnesium_polylepis.2